MHRPARRSRSFWPRWQCSLSPSATSCLGWTS
nr:MAG TPA: hypothetical protein [Caudoviricetes sp.]